MNCPNCNAELKEGMKFCPSCGREINTNIICPKCGREVKNGLKFCSNCGNQVSGKEEIEANSCEPTNVENIHEKENYQYLLNQSNNKSNKERDKENSRNINHNRYKKILMYGCVGVLCYFLVSLLGGSLLGSSSSSFVGEYNINREGFDYPFTIHEDGRCIYHSKYLFKEGYKDIYIGNVQVLSKTAFRITGASDPIHIDDLHIYNSEGNEVGSISNLYLLDLVFDTSDYSIYFHRSDFDNKDISTPDHGKFWKE